MYPNGAWQKLIAHRKQLDTVTLRDLFSGDKNRFQQFSLEAAGLFLDFSKQRILPETFNLLCQLAQEAQISKARDDLFQGKIVNVTEGRPALHTALRSLSSEPILVAGKNIKPLIKEVLERMERCVTYIREGAWLGFSGKPIEAIVNIGIGGSDLGPLMAVQALTSFTSRRLQYHFVSNVDPTNISETLRKLNPESTLFIVASKTFTTQETLHNANAAREWLLKTAKVSGKDEAAIIKQHFVAVTAKPERAAAFGIISENIYPFWDWVGGRYSLWSAIGLSLAIAIGMDNFRSMLAGAEEMDIHFKEAPYHANMPVIMALLGIWNINFWQASTHAVIPYEQYLFWLPFYLQQLDMESNGKHVNIAGNPVDYSTAPIVWGTVGTNGQHSYHQLLLQGTHLVPVDFIVSAQSNNPIDGQHLLLVANCLAQSQALMQGKNEREVLDELRAQGMSAAEAQKLAPHKTIVGNIPSNTIMMPQLNPHTLGAMLALYEHKVFVQGVIWQINSFDQWGVELGKLLANNIADSLRAEGSADTSSVDGSTYGLMQQYKMYRSK